MSDNIKYPFIQRIPNSTIDLKGAYEIFAVANSDNYGIMVHAIKRCVTVAQVQNSHKVSKLSVMSVTQQYPAEVC